MKRILIVENHHSTLMRLAQIARRIIGDTQIYTVDNVSEAYRLSMEYTIDLFVVDVVLEPASPGDTSGMKFVDRIRQIEKYYFVPVVMISALEDAGYYCYSKLHCYDYIEKPFDEERVYQAMEKCLKYQTKVSPPPNLYFRKEGIIYQVDVQEIVFIESHERCLHIHTLSERLEIPYITLKKVLNDIGEYGFVQCSRNAIVNRKYIAYIDKSNGYLGMKPNRQKIEIGLNFKQNI